jgi:Helix-turn-helix domain
LVALYSPAEIAKALGCSEWWVKDQARKRRIPFAWIGGGYRFTSEHLREIIRIFEKRPAIGTPAEIEAPSTSRPRAPRTTMTAVRLKARPPKRAGRSQSVA